MYTSQKVLKKMPYFQNVQNLTIFFMFKHTFRVSLIILESFIILSICSITIVEIIEALQQVYGEATPCRAVFYDWIKHFK